MKKAEEMMTEEQKEGSKKRVERSNEMEKEGLIETVDGIGILGKGLEDDFNVEGFEELQVFKDLEKEAKEAHRRYAVIVRNACNFEINLYDSVRTTSPGVGVFDRFVKNIELPDVDGEDVDGKKDFSKLAHRNAVIKKMLGKSRYLFMVN